MSLPGPSARTQAAVVPDTEALLAAVGAAWALDIAPDLIGAGIKTFEPDLPPPPGLRT